MTDYATAVAAKAAADLEVAQAELPLVQAVQEALADPKIDALVAAATSVKAIDDASLAQQQANNIINCIANWRSLVATDVTRIQGVITKLTPAPAPTNAQPGS